MENKNAIEITNAARVILAPNLEAAKKVVENHFVPATVEAEYGEEVFEGNCYTLAHHVGRYAGRPAPCVREVKPLTISNPPSVILISHIDADTIGGVLALLGKKPKSKEFWEAVAFVDVNGPHNAYKLSCIQQDMLNAYHAWATPHWFNSETDVTELVLSYVEPIQKIISFDEKMILAGKVWAKKVLDSTEICLLQETKNYRAFNTTGVFCAGSYFSPGFQRVVPCTISLNLSTSAITIAFEDGGKTLSAKNIVQRLWGPDAGGHAGIAGTPRGWKKTSDELEVEFFRAIDYIESLYESI